MSDELYDREILSTVRLDRLQDRLASTGWQPSAVAGKGVIWTLGVGNDAFEVAIPLTTTARDFPIRMQEALTVLAAVEQLGVRELLEQIREKVEKSNADLVGQIGLRLVQ